MAIYFYDKGDHPTGFIGFRVSVSINAQVHQRYFPVTNTDPTSREYKVQRLHACYQQRWWLQQSIETEYQQIVTTSSPKTPPEKALGVHGLTISFYFPYHNRDDAKPVFRVNQQSGKGDAVFRIDRKGYTGAWQAAVSRWAHRYHVQEADYQRILVNPPEPQRFKHLRRFENQHNGRDIPVEALEPVFREQRERLQRQRAAQRFSQEQLAPPGKPSANMSSQSLAESMASWFSEEVTSYVEKQ